MHLRRRFAAPIVVFTFSALAIACHDAGVIPFGPGLLPDQASVRLSVGATGRVGTDWTATASEPATLRVRWMVEQPALVAIDSVARDTRTVYLRGLARGTTRVSAADAVTGGAFSIPVTVE